MHSQGFFQEQAPPAHQQPAQPDAFHDAGYSYQYSTPSVPDIEVEEEPPATEASFLNDILRIGRQIDDVLYGKHSLIFFIAALLIVISQIINVFWNKRWPEYLAISLFVAATVFLVFCRVSSYRDEEGKWKLRLAIGRAKTGLLGLWETIVNFSKMPRQEKNLTLSKIAFIGGILLIALRAVIMIFIELHTAASGRNQS